jgi:hypothetical protein
LVGKTINGDYYWLDYVFEDGDFKGAVGSVFRPVTNAEKKERMSIGNAKDNLEDLWKDAVASGDTTQSLEDYV